MNWFEHNWLVLIMITFMVTIAGVSYFKQREDNKKRRREIKSGKYKLPESDAAEYMRKRHGWK